MSDSLDRLSAFAYTLYKLGLKQAAADYDYLVAWFRSTEWTKDGSHVGVVPAGNKTNSPDTGNCPIPYPITASDIAGLGNVEEITNCLTSVYSILEDVVAESGTGTAEELSVINEYQNYTYETVGVIDEDVQEVLPQPPPREDEQIVVTLPGVTCTEVVFSNQSVDADSSTSYQIFTSDSGSIEYNSSHTYHTNLCNENNYYNYQFDTVNKDNNGYLGVQYLGTGYITVSSGIVFICNADVDVVYVKNTTTNEVFTAFEYTADNNDEYYYVCNTLIQEWVSYNDLQNLGYIIDDSVNPATYQGETHGQGGNEEPGGNDNPDPGTGDNPSQDEPVQISVEIVDTQIFNASIVNNSTMYDLFKTNYDVLTYEPNTTYHTVVYNGSGITYYYQFGCENINSKVYLHYRGQNSVNVGSCKTFICHDSEHTTIDYVNTTNLSQDIIAAFKYALDNVYYYFVCDGVNQSWIRSDNLENEGYSIAYNVIPENYIGDYNSGGNDDPDEPQLPVPFAVRDNIKHIEYIDILLGLDVNQFNAIIKCTFGVNDFKYAGLLNDEDRQRVLDFGCSTFDRDWTYGELKYQPDKFYYRPLALYLDKEGENLNTDDMSNFYCYTSMTENKVLSINSIDAYDTQSRTWLCRITKL